MTIRFGPFTLDIDARQLRRGADDIHLSPKAFDVLCALAVERPNVVAKAVLQQRLWPDTFVADANLSNLVAEVREALGDDPRTPHFIRTVHRRGYAFCGDAIAAAAAPDAPAPLGSCWIEWGVRRFPLPPGEHLVGRDPGAAVRIDAPTVSRRHARLIVSGSGVLLEDLGSKNGTFRDGERVESPLTLRHGDRIKFGSVLVTFHEPSPPGSTDTQTDTFH